MQGKVFNPESRSSFQMETFFLSFGYIAGILIDIIVLFFVAGFLKIRGNSFGKAAILVVVSAILGYIVGPLLLAAFFVSVSAFLLALIAGLVIRLILIKGVYRIGFSKAISLGVVSAVVSLAVSWFIPV